MVASSGTSTKRIFASASIFFAFAQNGQPSRDSTRHGVRGLRVGGEVLQHGVGVGHLERVAFLVGFDEHLLDHTVAHEHRVAPRAVAEVQVALVDEHAHLAGELGVAVRQHRQVVAVLVARPLLHDERVVDGQAHDVVDAVLAEHRRQLVVAGQVGGRAGGREGAGQREDDDVAALEQLAAVDGGPVVVAAHAERDVGDPVAFLAVVGCGVGHGSSSRDGRFREDAAGAGPRV